jgi:hypothetical protein
MNIQKLANENKVSKYRIIAFIVMIYLYHVIFMIAVIIHTKWQKLRRKYKTTSNERETAIRTLINSDTN